jgi:hypothetical protein
MPIWKIDDMLKVINNLKGIRFKRNSKVSIDIDKDYLYINGYACPTGTGSTGMVPIIGGSGKVNWGYAGGTTGASIQGDTGLQGVTGIDGAYASMGFTGAQGLTGSEGLTGSQGITGLQGITGSQGLTGSEGLTGSQGSTGLSIPGYTGLIGITGSQGLTGPAGELIALYGTDVPPSPVGYANGTVYIRYVS